MSANERRLLVGTQVIPLESDHIYAVKLPPDATVEDMEQTQTALWHFRHHDPEHAPRFIICRHDVEIASTDEVQA